MTQRSDSGPTSWDPTFQGVPKDEMRMSQDYEEPRASATAE